MAPGMGSWWRFLSRGGTPHNDLHGEALRKGDLFWASGIQKSRYFTS